MERESKGDEYRNCFFGFFVFEIFFVFEKDAKNIDEDMGRNQSTKELNGVVWKVRETGESCREKRRKITGHGKVVHCFYGDNMVFYGFKQK